MNFQQNKSPLGITKAWSSGPGFLLWDNSHALTCLRMAIHVKEFLDKKLPNHNKSLGLKGAFLELDYGFAIHSGGSTIERTTFIKDDLQLSKDFIFGIVANSVSRLESFTKTYVDYKVLVTGNYKDVFENQAKSERIKSLFANGTGYYRTSLGRVNIKDGKEKPNKGHNVYALTDDFLNTFKRLYK